jgi:hypothetical protein
MKLLVKNIQYFEIEIPGDYNDEVDSEVQDMLDSCDEYISEELVSDDYYEFVEIISTEKALLDKGLIQTKEV